MTSETTNATNGISGQSQVYAQRKRNKANQSKQLIISLVKEPMFISSYKLSNYFSIGFHKGRALIKVLYGQFFLLFLIPFIFGGAVLGSNTGSCACYSSILPHEPLLPNFDFSLFFGEGLFLPEASFRHR
jgi:hypothetical protein